MQTMQRRRQRDGGLLPHGGNPGSTGARYRSAADSVADAADREMLDALANTDTVLKSVPQQTGE